MIAAGFSDGAASITAGEGPNRDDRSYKPEKTARSRSRASTARLQVRQLNVAVSDRFPERDPANEAERVREQRH